MNSLPLNSAAFILNEPLSGSTNPLFVLLTRLTNSVTCCSLDEISFRARFGCVTVPSINCASDWAGMTDLNLLGRGSAISEESVVSGKTFGVSTILSMIDSASSLTASTVFNAVGCGAS